MPRKRTNKRSPAKKLLRADRNFYKRRTGLERALIENEMSGRPGKSNIQGKIREMEAWCKHPTTWGGKDEPRRCERCGATIRELFPATATTTAEIVAA